MPLLSDRVPAADITKNMEFCGLDNVVRPLLLTRGNSRGPSRLVDVATVTAVNSAATPAAAATPATIDAVFGALLQQMTADASNAAAPTGTFMSSLVAANMLQAGAGQTAQQSASAAAAPGLSNAGTTSAPTNAQANTLNISAALTQAAAPQNTAVATASRTADATSAAPADGTADNNSTDKNAGTDPMLALFVPLWSPPVAASPAKTANATVSGASASDSAVPAAAPTDGQQKAAAPDQADQTNAAAVLAAAQTAPQAGASAGASQAAAPQATASQAAAPQTAVPQAGSQSAPGSSAAAKDPQPAPQIGDLAAQQDTQSGAPQSDGTQADGTQADGTQAGGTQAGEPQADTKTATKETPASQDNSAPVQPVDMAPLLAQQQAAAAQAVATPAAQPTSTAKRTEPSSDQTTVTNAAAALVAARANAQTSPDAKSSAKDDGKAKSAAKKDGADEPAGTSNQPSATATAQATDPRVFQPSEQPAGHQNANTPAHAAVPPANHAPANDAAQLAAAQPQTPAQQQAVTAEVQVSAQRHTADVPTAFDKLGVTIAAKSIEGLHQFEIRLDPAELGRVDVKLTVDSSGQAQANLVVDNPKTLELLQRDASSLNRALTDAGLNLSGSGLSFSLREQQQQQTGGGSQKSRGRGLSVNAAASANIPASRSASGSYAPDSVRLDIRV